MADPNDAVTLAGALSFLGPLIGAGGVTAIVVAWFGSRKPHAAEDHEAKPATMGIQALLADQMAMERLINELRRLADVGEDVAKVGNRFCDLMDITSAIERLRAAERK